MALDVYVMPLWRFKAGDVISPIELATGMRPRILTRDGVHERPARVGWLARWRARRDVSALRRAVRKATGTTIEWNDEGAQVHAAQFRHPSALRAYARWLDCRQQFPEFPLPEDGDYSSHPAFGIAAIRLSCPHLVRHDLYSGYYLPCEFAKVAQVEPYLRFGDEPATRPAGSSPRLLKELDRIQQELRVPTDYSYPDDDPLLPVRDAYLQLREAAELSVQHGLPIVFWG